MTATLQGRRVLVVEDEYLLADDLRDTLQEAGAEVLGPVPDPDSAFALLEEDGRIDAALLDINLNGTLVFPLADALIERGIPVAFATGYDRYAVPGRFAAVPRLEKPLRSRDVIAVLDPLIA